MKHLTKSLLSLLTGTSIAASLLLTPVQASDLETPLDDAYYGQLRGQNVSLNVYN